MGVNMFLYNVFILVLSMSCKSNSAPSPGGEKPLEKRYKKIVLDDKYIVSGGHHTPHYLGATGAPYGFFVFTPTGYNETEEKFPLLVFLHGSGETGNSRLDTAALYHVIRHAPPNIIQEGKWDRAQKMIVVSPQCHEYWWQRDSIRKFIAYVKDEYRVDESRIYLTGLSMGGYATFDYLAAFGDEGRVAAAVVICGSGELNEQNNRNLAKVPIWVFHGEKDYNVSPAYSKAIVPIINLINGKPLSRITIFPEAGHDTWTMTYNGSGMGKEDERFDTFRQDVFSWLLQHSR